MPRGQFLGNEFLVNTTTPGNQNEPAVAMDNQGRFAVVWQGPGPDQEDIFLRLFDPNGNARTPELAVNLMTAGRQLYPQRGGGRRRHARRGLGEPRNDATEADGGSRATLRSERFPSRRRGHCGHGYLRLPVSAGGDGRGRPFRRDVDAGSKHPSHHPASVRSLRRADHAAAAGEHGQYLLRSSADHRDELARILPGGLGRPSQGGEPGRYLRPLLRADRRRPGRAVPRQYPPHGRATAASRHK